MQQADIHFRQALSLLMDMNDQHSIPSLIRLAFKCSDAGSRTPGEDDAHLMRVGQCDISLPLLLVEDWADGLPIWSIWHVLDFLDASQSVICRDISSTRGKGLVLLRLCNELLRRLSKSQDSTLSGRLLLFLSKVFPSAERSGVNLRGDINVENTTEIATWDDDSNEDESRALFVSFWGIQYYMYHPVQSLMIENWGKIKKTLEETLEMLERVKAIQDYQEIREFFPKFLANRKLFPLQLNDPSWRTVLLVQCSIYLQHLLAYSHNEEHKPPCAKALSTGLLTEDQELWIKECERRVMQHLRKGCSDGHLEAQIHQILLHERNWMAWKANSCPSFEQPVSPTFILPPASTARHFSEDCEKVLEERNLGSAELSRLWEHQSTEHSLKGRRLVPMLDEYLEPLISQLKALDDENSCETEALLYSRDELFRWGLYRLLLASECSEAKQLWTLDTPEEIDRFCRVKFAQHEAPNNNNQQV